MTTIIASLTTEQFIRAFGDNEYVRDFSQEGVEYILSYVSDSQDSKECTADWKSFFTDASEVTPENLINDNKHELKDYPDKILELVCDMDGATDDLINKIDENEDDLSDADLLASLQSEIEGLEGYARAVANLIADDKGWHELSNGNYVIID